jgi:putative oxidoreductase
MLRGEWAMVPLRLMIGYGIAAHGYAKLLRGPSSFAVILAAMGTPAPGFTAWLITLLELGGGLLLMAGAFVVPLSLPLGAILAVAMAAVHARYGFSSVRLVSFSAEVGARFGPIGYEIDLLYLAGLVTLVLARSTPVSVDRWLERARASARRRAG